MAYFHTPCLKIVQIICSRISMYKISTQSYAQEISYSRIRQLKSIVQLLVCVYQCPKLLQKCNLLWYNTTSILYYVVKCDHAHLFTLEYGFLTYLCLGAKTVEGNYITNAIAHLYNNCVPANASSDPIPNTIDHMIPKGGQGCNRTRRFKYCNMESTTDLVTAQLLA